MMSCNDYEPETCLNPRFSPRIRRDISSVIKKLNCEYFKKKKKQGSVLLIKDFDPLNQQESQYHANKADAVTILFLYFLLIFLF